MQNSNLFWNERGPEQIVPAPPVTAKKAAHCTLAWFSLNKAPADRRNEDRLFFRAGSNNSLIAAVFDGIGSSSGGISADTACSAFTRFVDDRLASLSGDGFRRRSFLRDAILFANQELLEFARKNKIDDVGTTVSAVSVFGSSVICANLGDSPVLSYFCRSGRLQSLFDQHRDPLGGLTRWIGDPELGRSQIPIHYGRITKDSLLLLGTDGALESFSAPYPLRTGSPASVSRHYKSYTDLFGDHLKEENGLTPHSAAELAGAVAAAVDDLPTHDDASLIIIQRE